MRLCGVLVIASVAATSDGETNTSARAIVDALVGAAIADAARARRAMSADVVAAPSPARPFVFFHQRKCGGSAVRQMVAAAADARGLRAYIPGRPARAGEPYVGPETYEPPQHARWRGPFEDVSVLAGHLSWPGVVQGLYAKEAHAASVRPAEVAFDCLTIFRETVSRVESC